MKKYELLKEDTISLMGRTLYCVRYLCDFANIKKGDLGGYIEKEENLSHDGNARVCGNAWVYDNARVYGDAWVYGNARVFGNVRLFGDAWVCGYAEVFGDARVFGDAWVRGNAWVYGDACVYSDSVCAILSPIIIVGLRWNVTLTDNNIHIGSKTLNFEKALALASRWKDTMLKYEEAQKIEDEKKLLVEAIRFRLKQLEKARKETL